MEILVMSIVIFYLVWIFFIPSKKYNFFLKRNDKVTNDWLCKRIVNKMWNEKEIWFTNKGLDNFNAKIKHIKESEEENKQRTNEAINIIDKVVRDINNTSVGFDPLGIYSLQKDSMVKYQETVWKGTLSIGKSMLEATNSLVKLMAYYELLEHTNEFIKKDSFLKEAFVAIDKDLLFIENKKTKLGEKDRMCFAFVETLLNICDKSGKMSYELEQYRNRYKSIKENSLK